MRSNTLSLNNTLQLARAINDRMKEIESELTQEMENKYPNKDDDEIFQLVDEVSENNPEYMELLQARTDMDEKDSVNMISVMKFLKGGLLDNVV